MSDDNDRIYKKMAKDAKLLKAADGRVLKSFIGVVTKN
jgi:hypothetical protein